ncbi:glycosyltransferase family 4 protein [Saccharicrinis sp. 156]|uniref:glycosyltransferase family 4 protein n=1 Tax=Saccharicrinis sp. 156 TaxID=3417574 RepID=UPI003D32E016
MKVLWITNTIFPKVCEKLKIPKPVVGGWMYAGATSILENENSIELGVATLYPGKKLLIYHIEGISYFLLPKNKDLECNWEKINSNFFPDVVHIHGTEYAIGLPFVNACGAKGVVVSIQGLVSTYGEYYLGGIAKRDLLKNITLRDIFKRDTIFNQKIRMKKRGFREKELLSSVNHVIGRTSWDYAHTLAINPKVKYHFCNETLRESFYKKKWLLDSCEKYTIFLSQAHYPLKGIQQMIKALPLILYKFPQTRVYVAGNDFLNKGFKISGYGKYIRKLLVKHNVLSKFSFTGLLDEDEMTSRFLKSHVFVCPSSIENSPNSVGEAQLLGVPCVSSYVGGVADMISSGTNGLTYRYEEFEMLAQKVCEIFSNDAFAVKLSENGRETAFQRHDRSINAQNLVSIYKELCKK